MSKKLFTTLWLTPSLVLLTATIALAEPITGTVSHDYSPESWGAYYTVSGTNLFGNLPLGPVAEIASATEAVEFLTDNQHYTISMDVPIPTYGDGTAAELDDMFFIVLPQALYVDAPDGLVMYELDCTYTGGSSVQIESSITGQASVHGTVKIKAFACRIDPVATASVSLSDLKELFE